MVRHKDIRAWVSARRGQPAISSVRDRLGEMRAKLTLSFDKRAERPQAAPSIDDGLSPCSWTAWLAELDRQHLALKVNPGSQPEYELVPRRDYN
ncbi:hypothetical protein EMQ25_14495 [Arsenicitalea aurantiaca]|uniref:Uncharacterized protein n=1 Tax=Arsenicitalea aurantiaca TaxID=1783274 RepID=A0A433X5I9_9HYPH|nr:hypothetical protein [Arsenicitalea aurantiaca]RUT29329.1 hypothetical protein EMQ25_14495 [Arsenicitalea aurantiaca]